MKHQYSLHYSGSTLDSTPACQMRSSSSNHACDCGRDGECASIDIDLFDENNAQRYETRIPKPMNIFACSSSSHQPLLPSPPLPTRLRSPGPRASPDERMLFMTVDELLTTEVRYVHSLQYVLKVRN